MQNGPFDIGILHLSLSQDCFVKINGKEIDPPQVRIDETRLAQGPHEQIDMAHVSPFQVAFGKPASFGGNAVEIAEREPETRASSP